jgi:hypothetical protein
VGAAVWDVAADGFGVGLRARSLLKKAASGDGSAS